MKEICVDGHGGHMCEAHCDGVWAVGDTIDNAMQLAHLLV